jgi:hypothetical protein
MSKCLFSPTSPQKMAASHAIRFHWRFWVWLHALYLECPAGLVQDNTVGILISPVSRPAYGRVSGTVLLAKKIHTTQSVWHIFYLVSPQLGAVVLDYKSNSAIGSHRVWTFVLIWSSLWTMTLWHPWWANLWHRSLGLSHCCDYSEPGGLLLCKFQKLTNLKHKWENSKTENVKHQISGNSIN